MNTTVFLPTDPQNPLAPPRPAPYLLTEAEAALLLRIDAKPGPAVKRLRMSGRLRSVGGLGHARRYRLKDVLQCIDHLAE